MIWVREGAYEIYVQENIQKDVTGKLPKQAGLLRCWRVGSPVQGKECLFLCACQALSKVRVLLRMAVCFALHVFMEMMLQKTSSPPHSGLC